MRQSLKILIPSLAILFALMLCVTDVMAQGGDRGGRQRGGRDGGGGDNSQRLLRTEAVQRDLELTEEQATLLEELNEGRGGDRGARGADLEGLSDEARAEKLREMRDARTQDRTAQLNDILLPHQMERLSQIVAQASAQGGAGSLINGSLAEKLEITDEQKERIQKKAEALQKELDEAIAKLRAKMQAKLLEELTPEQQAQFKEMTGDTFAFEQRQRGGGQGGDRGAGGGRGGDRGAGGGRGGDRGAGGGRGGERDRGGNRNNDDA